MKSLKELYEQRASVITQMKDLPARAKTENRELTADEKEQWGRIDADYERLTKEIAETSKMQARLAEISENEAESREDRAYHNPKGAQGKDEAEEKREECNKAFWQYARFGGSSLTAAQSALMQEIRGTNPQITTVDGQGGYLIPEGFSNQLETRMKFFGGMLEAAQEFNTTTGNPIAWPVVDDTAVVGALLDEASPSIAVDDMTFTQVMVNAYTYTSKFVKVSRQLAQDSAFDLAGFLQEQFANRLGRAINAALTTADGTNKPYGVVNAVVAASGLVAAQNDDVITRVDLVNLQHGVDRAYRFNGSYMFNDTTLAAIKKLSFGTGDDRPLWQPSMIVGEPDRVEGFQYFINNDMANIADGAYPVLFGDFKKYVYRTVGQTVFLALNERFADTLQIGYIAYKRVDGELIQTNAIKALRMLNT